MFSCNFDAVFSHLFRDDRHPRYLLITNALIVSDRNNTDTGLSYIHRKMSRMRFHFLRQHKVKVLMVTLTINRKPQGIFAKPQQDQTNTAHKGRIPPQVNDRQKPANKTPWRHMTKRQRKNRKRINRLVELWPELFNRENPKPIKVGIADDLIQDITLRKQVFGTGALFMNGALIAVVTFLISAVVCVPVGMVIRKKTAESKIKGAENEASRILANAKKEAEKGNN